MMAVSGISFSRLSTYSKATGGRGGTTFLTTNFFFPLEGLASGPFNDGDFHIISLFFTLPEAGVDSPVNSAIACDAANKNTTNLSIGDL